MSNLNNLFLSHPLFLMSFILGHTFRRKKHFDLICLSFLKIFLKMQINDYLSTMILLSLNCIKKFQDIFNYQTQINVLLVICRTLSIKHFIL